MDQTTQTHLAYIQTKDKALQNAAYYYLMEATAVPVDWAYYAWDELVAGLTHKDNHVRAINSQLLCQLAKSDPEKRILADFDKLLAVTKDERFVTARHCLQSLWKVGVVGVEQQQMVVDGLDGRYRECITEKNGTLIRSDIITGLANLYDAVKDETIKERAWALIETETDPKYRKKYATAWKNQ
ncbi:MAG TPA: hypothetical protein PLD25_21530 [Chloroflexota bacterium]|nr:hypothetical protein [Chloroflexota bacterium]HUM69017.1 hypothetical protein [Chloroflexota bacterium]